MPSPDAGRSEEHTVPADQQLPPSIVRRAATIARGPYACPNCECPTFTEPPVPWIGLRDYLVRCEVCERPIAVRVDADRIRRRRGLRAYADWPDMYEPVAELLDRRDLRAFAARVACAVPVPVVLAVLALLAGMHGAPFVLLVAAAIVASSMWAPAVVAGVWGASLERSLGIRTARRKRRHQPLDVIEVAPGRWDQWMREERRRRHEVADHPHAVLRELERVLDDRELRRVRALAQRGEVPPTHLLDLLRFRRSWRADVA
jgi:hypothetical protein